MCFGKKKIEEPEFKDPKEDVKPVDEKPVDRSPYYMDEELYNLYLDLKSKADGDSYVYYIGEPDDIGIIGVSIQVLGFSGGSSWRRDEMRAVIEYRFENGTSTVSPSSYTHCELSRTEALIKRMRLCLKEEYLEHVDSIQRKYREDFQNEDIKTTWYKHGVINEMSDCSSLYGVKIKSKIIHDKICYVSYAVCDIVNCPNYWRNMGEMEWSIFKVNFSKDMPEYVELNV